MNKVVDECNNTYHGSIGKKHVNADYSALTKEMEMNPKSSKFKADDEYGRWKLILGLIKRKIYTKK